MTKREDELRRAACSMASFDASSIEEAVEKIGPSPLGELIASVLASIPAGAKYDVLERIKSLKQGTFEDLEDPEFQSFLIAYLRIDLSVLRWITHVLRTARLVSSGALTNDPLEVAARGDATSSPLTGNELAVLLSRRRFPV